MSKVAISGITVLFVAFCAGFFMLGSNLTRSAYANDLAATQAMLAFNNMQRYQEIVLCLDENSITEAEDLARFSELEERELLSELLQGLNVPWLNEYIELRSQDSIETLRNFEAGQDATRTAIEC